MRALLVLAVLLAGCVQTTITPPPAPPREAHVDMCPHPWPYLVDGNDARVGYVVGKAPDPPLSIGVLTYSLAWGTDAAREETRSEPLARLVDGSGAWRLLDVDGDGALSGGDRVVGDAPGAAWRILLFDAGGAFVGGSPECA